MILSGASASGKTVLAPRLARSLGLPLLAKDDIKEGIYQGLGLPRDRDDSRRMGGAAYEVLWRLAARLVDVGVGAVVECNFWRGGAEPKLRPLVVGSRAVLVHCQTDRATLLRRRLARIEGLAKRHPGHVDASTPAEIGALLGDPARLAALEIPDEESLDLDVPILRVDTTDDYAPSFAALVAWTEDALRPVLTLARSAPGTPAGRGQRCQAAGRRDRRQSWPRRRRSTLTAPVAIARARILPGATPQRCASATNCRYWSED